jgi:L-Ala-D/L-Glu epimerase
MRASRLDVPMTKAFGIAGGAQTLAANVVVEVELANGIVGYGEAAPFPAFNGETQERALGACSAATAVVVGQRVEDAAGIASIVCRFDPTWPASARCAIESALFDAHAKERGRSLRALFGGAEDSLLTDITITTGSEDDAEREARSFADFSTLKIKVGGTDVDHDLRRVLAVRRVRSDARILVDANGGFSVEEAIAFARELRKRGVVPFFFEQPIAAGSWDALAEVRAQSGLAIAIDESVTGVADVESAKEHAAADAVNVKIMKSGIVEAIAIVRAAERIGLARMIGGMVETRLAMSISACIAAGHGGFAIVDLDTPLFLAEDPWIGGYEQRGERIDLRPIGAGHGLRPRSPIAE